MRIAALDLGTNSFLCLIAEISGEAAHRRLSIIKDMAELVRLGQGVHENRRFHPEALDRAKRCLELFRKELDQFKPQVVVATATSAARDVSNGHELLAICENLNIPVSTISGALEARLSFAGAISGLTNVEKMTVGLIDVGGGSTELVCGRAIGNLHAQSFDIGAVRMTELLFSQDPTDPNKIEVLKETARNIFASYPDLKPDFTVAVAGTPTTLACISKGIDFKEELVEATYLSQGQIFELAERLVRLPLTERQKIPGLPALRADVIVAGAVILGCAMEKLGAEKVYVSTRGLRFGAALHYEELQ